MFHILFLNEYILFNRLYSHFVRFLFCKVLYTGENALCFVFFLVVIRFKQNAYLLNKFIMSEANTSMHVVHYTQLHQDNKCDVLLDSNNIPIHFRSAIRFTAVFLRTMSERQMVYYFFLLQLKKENKMCSVSFRSA